MKIERLKSGTYRVLVYLGRDANGKQIMKSLTDKNKTRLARRAAEYVEQYRGKIGYSRDSFGAALAEYIKAREPLLSPSTIAGYRSNERSLAQYDWFVRKPLIDLTEADMRKLVNLMAGKSPKTIRNLTGLISAVFEFNGLKAPVTRLPAKRISDRDIPEAELMMQILQAAKGTRLEVPLSLAVMGLRRSEICGLSITDLDRDGVLHIHRGAVYGEGGALVVKDSVKNATSDRYVQLPAPLARTIRQQGYVTDMTPAALTAAFPHFLRRHGFPPMRLHDCRHFMASYLHSLGVPDAEIMRMGGWKTDHVMKNVYRHALAKKETAQRVAGAYGELMDG